MLNSKTYQRYSMLCLDEARKAHNSKQRVLLAEMAQQWQRLALQAAAVVGASGLSNSNLELDRETKSLLWCRLFSALQLGRRGVIVTGTMFILIAVEAVFFTACAAIIGATIAERRSLSPFEAVEAPNALSQRFPVADGASLVVRALGPGTCRAKSRNLTDIRALNKSGANVGANSWPLQSSTYLPLRQFSWRHSPASLPPRRGTRACIDPHLIRCATKIKSDQVDASRGAFLWQ